ncbi:hypothetical protein ON010_g15132 [Phytophthora cinnamomi]|nr:hypothetical protein ON010_g15132 [Phytophthora cinnamomi]
MFAFSQHNISACFSGYNCTLPCSLPALLTLVAPAKFVVTPCAAETLGRFPEIIGGAATTSQGRAAGAVVAEAPQQQGKAMRSEGLRLPGHAGHVGFNVGSCTYTFPTIATGSLREYCR